MKSSNFLAKMDNDPQTKSPSAKSECIIKQEPLEPKPEFLSTTNVPIQPNPIASQLVPVNQPQQTILVPTQQQFQMVSAPNNLVPIATLPQQHLVPVSITSVPGAIPQAAPLSAPAPNPTISTQESALKALQQSLSLKTQSQRKSPQNSNNVNIKTEPNLNINNNNGVQLIPKGLPPLPPRAIGNNPIIPQQQTLLFYQQRQQFLPNHGIPSIKDEKLNENWSAKIAYAATLSSVKYLKQE